jgi:hypothetical protein
MGVIANLTNIDGTLRIMKEQSNFQVSYQNIDESFHEGTLKMGVIVN